MHRICLDIKDVQVIEKLENFIYEYSHIDYNNLQKVINSTVMGNKADGLEKSEDDLFQLRELLHTHFTDHIYAYTEDELGSVINTYLYYLRTYNVETNECLETVIDAVKGSGRTALSWDCVKRLTGVLASLFLLYYSPKAKLFEKEDTDSNMKSIFRMCMKYFSIEDKRFLIHLFIYLNEFECLADILSSYLKIEGIEERATPESERTMLYNFYGILSRFTNSKRYGDALRFCKYNEDLFSRMKSGDVLKGWDNARFGILMALGKYEDARLIQDKYIEPDVKACSIEDILDLYNGACCYAWSVKKKEENSSAWKEGIDKAYSLISSAEACARTLKDNNKINESLYCNVMLEKAYLLAEKKEFESAFTYYTNNVNDKVLKEFDLNSQYWLLASYMFWDEVHQNSPEDSKTAVINQNNKNALLQLNTLHWIEYLVNQSRHKMENGYVSIVNFMKEKEPFIDSCGETFKNEIYRLMLRFQYLAYEIKHMAKLRDVSQYDILYYTKMEHLKLLLEDEEPEYCKYRMPMFHVNHMNDPQEGKMIRQFLYCEDNLFCTADADNNSSTFRRRFDEEYTFLKSFFSYHKDPKEGETREFLPMWVQYGDNAQGCCVILNEKTFENCNLYRILYVSNELCCDNPEINLYLQWFAYTYREIADLCRNELLDKAADKTGEFSESAKECLDGITNLINGIISQIIYLFKHKSYEHENEVRLIYSKADKQYKDIKTISGSVPKTYIYTNEQTYIDEIILGARLKNPADYLPFIFMHGQNMWQDERDKQIKVTLSNIQYR